MQAYNEMMAQSISRRQFLISLGMFLLLLLTGMLHYASHLFYPEVEQGFGSGPFGSGPYGQ